MQGAQIAAASLVRGLLQCWAMHCTETGAVRLLCGYICLHCSASSDSLARFACVCMCSHTFVCVCVRVEVRAVNRSVRVVSQTSVAGVKLGSRPTVGMPLQFRGLGGRTVAHAPQVGAFTSYPEWLAGRWEP